MASEYVLPDPDDETTERPGLRRITRRGKGAHHMPMWFARDGLGITQAELARAMGIDQSDVSRIERRPDLLVSTLRRYAEALGLKAEIAFVFKDGRRALISFPPDGVEPPK